MKRKDMLEYQANRNYLTDLLIKSIEEGKHDQIANWVRNKIFNKNASLNIQKAFFDAEKIALGGFLERGARESLEQLLKVFNGLIQEVQGEDYGHNFKSTEFKVVTDAIQSVDNPKQYSNVLHEILNSFSDYKNSQEFCGLLENNILLGQEAQSSEEEMS